MQSLLIFQNFGFENSRWFVLVLGCFLFIVLRQTVSPVSQRILLVMVPIYVPVILVAISFESAPIFDFFSTIVYSIGCVYCFRSSNSFDYKVALVLFSVGAAILLYSSEFRPSELVRELRISGNDNRFSGVLLVLLVGLWFRQRISTSLIQSVAFLYVCLSVDARLTAFGTVTVFLLFVLINRLRFSKPATLIISVLYIFIYNVVYFALTFHGEDLSAIWRAELTMDALSWEHIEGEYFEPHFPTLGIWMHTGLIGFIVLSLGFLAIPPFALIAAIVAFSATSNFFSEIWIFAVVYLTLVIRDSRKVQGKVSS